MSMIWRTDGVTYGDVWHENEYEQSVYSYELSDRYALQAV